MAAVSERFGPGTKSEASNEGALKLLLCDKCFATARTEGEWFSSTLLQYTQDTVKKGRKKKEYAHKGVQVRLEPVESRTPLLPLLPLQPLPLPLPLPLHLPLPLLLLLHLPLPLLLHLPLPLPLLPLPLPLPLLHLPLPL